MKVKISGQTGTSGFGIRGTYSNRKVTERRFEVRCGWKLFDWKALRGQLGESIQGADEVGLCTVAEGCGSFMIK